MTVSFTSDFAWLPRGNLLKMHICQGKVREQFSVSVCLNGLDTTI